MLVKLSSGDVDTSAVTPEQIAKLMTVLSYLDNCLEDGDDPGAEHEAIMELMRSVGLTPACDREDEGEDEGEDEEWCEADGTLSTTLTQLRLQLGCPVSSDYCPKTGELLIHLHHGKPHIVGGWAVENIGWRSLERVLKKLLPDVELSMEPLPDGFGGTTVRTGLDVDMDGCLYPISEREDD